MGDSLIAVLARKTDTAQRRTRRRLRRWYRPVRETTPVFVVGCQRSGTSMTLRVFDLSLDATVFWETDPRVFERGLFKSRAVVDEVIAGTGTRVAVLKPINQTQRAREYLEGYPGLRVVWLLRRYQDVVNSGVRRFKSMRDSLGRILTEPAKAGWWGESLSERSLAVLREHYRPEMSHESAYALFWYLRNSFFFELGLDAEPRVRVFRYEDLVARPHEQFEELFEFCRCPFKPRFIREVFPTSVGRNKSPRIDPPLEGLCRDLTEGFDRHLGSTREEAGPESAAIGKKAL